MSSMNENAKLYEQTLYYRRNSSPHQYLALPWWIRTPKPVFYPRHGCVLEPLNCGEKVFSRIADDVRCAKQSVDIITWGFDPGMVLVRGVAAELGQRFGDLLKEVATRVEHPVQVRIVVWHDDILSQRQMKNIPGYYGLRFPSIGCAVAGYYSASHQSYNAEWFEQVCNGGVPNISFRVRSIPAALLPSSMSGEASAHSLDATVAKLYATHHQKMMLIDYEVPAAAVGYVMGHNAITDFWDSKAHRFRDPRRERIYKTDPTKEHGAAWQQGPALDPAGGLPVPGFSPSKSALEQKERAAQLFLDKNSTIARPYQDVSCRLRGPILFDLNFNFCQAWRESEQPGAIFQSICRIPDWKYQLACKVMRQHDPDKFIDRRKALRLKAFSLPEGQHSVQLMRTQPLHGEKSIKECYANLARQMNHYIFVQNQYVQYEPWAEHLKECVRRLREGGFRKKVYVFILTSTPERAGMDLPTYNVAGKIGQSETMVWEHADAVNKAMRGKGGNPITPEQMAKDGINVVMGSLWTCADWPASVRLGPENYEEIYIHAKVAVVDDAAFTLGSANLNLRSMALDSELNILSDAMDVAYTLRTELFRQASGKPGPEQFKNMEDTLKEWRDMMRDNKNCMKNGQPLISQLLPFHVDRKPGSPVV